MRPQSILKHIQKQQYYIQLPRMMRGYTGKSILELSYRSFTLDILNYKWYA